MTVVKSVIKAGLLALYAQAETGPGLTPDQFADGMADIIRNAVLSATVNTNLTPVTATVTTSAPAGVWPVVGGTSTGGLT